jgi:O-glycosyl hydrolase
MRSGKRKLAGIFGILPVFGIIFIGCLTGGPKEKQEIEISARPLITTEPGSALYALDTVPGVLEVEAESPDGGMLAYQWYRNNKGAYDEAAAISGATASTYMPAAGNIGNLYYYVVVTNTAAGKKANSVKSAIAWIKVQQSLPPVGEPNAVITVNREIRYQKVTGFGGMMNTWTSPDMDVKDIDIMFSPDGLGYNILRTCLYPYMNDILDNTEEPGVDNSDYFELIKRVNSYGGKVLATPWTPPAEWKTNGSRIGGGTLKLENYGDFAMYLRSFIEMAESRGAPIYAVSVQNEYTFMASYDGCEYTEEEMYNFVKNYGSSIIEGTDVRLIPGEPHQYQSNRFDLILNDPDTEKKIDIVGLHLYGTAPQRMNLAIEKGKEVWMTEHLYNTAGNYDYDSTWPAVWEAAKDVHDCMSADFNAYVWWYLKRFYGMIGDGQYNTMERQILPRGYMLSHYARYASGKTRVEAVFDTVLNDVFVTAYESDHDISLVMFNCGNVPIEKININIPMTAKSVTGVKSSETAGGMAPALIILSTDKKTASVALPESTMLSVKFSK